MGFLGLAEQGGLKKRDGSGPRFRLQGPAEKNQAVKDPFFHAFYLAERCIPIMERKIPIATVIFCLC